MDEKIYNLLSTLTCPVRYGWYDENINKQHVTFFIVSDSPEEYEDDDEAIINYVVQVDVWSKYDDSETINKIKELMKTNGFTRIDSADLFEVDTKIYHKAIRFNYYEEV